MYSSVHGMAPVAVSSNGLFCAIVLLFLMLLFVIISIAACKWRMNKMLGFTMFMLYFVFLVLSVMLEDRMIICPVSIWAAHWLPVSNETANISVLISHFVLFYFTPPSLPRTWEPIGYLVEHECVYAKTFQQCHKVMYDVVFAVWCCNTFSPHFLHTPYTHIRTHLSYGAIHLTACDYGCNYSFPVHQSLGKLSPIPSYLFCLGKCLFYMFLMSFIFI